MSKPLLLLSFATLLASCTPFRGPAPEWPTGRPEGDYREMCLSHEISCRDERQMLRAYQTWERGNQATPQHRSGIGTGLKIAGEAMKTYADTLAAGTRPSIRCTPIGRDYICR